MPETHIRRVKIWSVGINKDVAHTPAVVEQGPEDRVYPHFIEVTGKNPDKHICYVMTDENNVPIVGAQTQQA